MASADQPPLRARSRSLLAALGLVAVLAASGVWWPAPAADAATDSATTVTAADYDPDYRTSPFPDLAVTVSQTRDLIQQGVTVSWTGAKPSSTPNNQTGGENYLQIMQCWGDEPGSGGTRPDRTTCQYGGLNLPGASRWSFRGEKNPIASQDRPYTAAGAGWWEPTLTAIPFRSATGETVASIVDGARVPDPPDLNNNQFFTRYTTNEVSWAGSGADGSGAVSFELQTVQQSPGLGCGTPVAGTASGTSCWLVVIPRGDKDPGESANIQSGLFWDTWKHQIAIRLGFKPTGNRCPEGSAERQLSGSELVSGAMGQWQPKLCNTAGGSVYALLTGPEPDAALAANGTAAAPLAITTRALSADGVTDNLAYAPVALTGVSIAFAIDRQAVATNDVPAAVLAKERLAFTSLKLTPRLLAKLLTASYTDALPQASDTSHLSGGRNLTTDPEFLAINDPEWKYMAIATVGVSDVLMPLGRSDAARAVWRYIMSDPAAVDFLNGVPDAWGMRVNPYYSTNPQLNPTGTALALPRDDFPKADPTEFPGLADTGFADAVNLVTWRPFTASLDAGGYSVLRGDPLSLGVWNSISIPPKYGRGDRALAGLQAVIGLTDTSAAAKYQVYQAALLNPAGSFVAPTGASLTAAAAAMTPDAKQVQVLGFDPASAAAKKAAEAYPLAMPVYAAVNPAMADSDLRASYASFIGYAAGDGQAPGTDDGELPDGYAPLPRSWVSAATAAAAAIRAGGWPTASASPSTSASPSASASSSRSASPSPSKPATPDPSRSPGAPTATPGGSPSTSGGGPSAGPPASGSPAGPLSTGATAADPSVGLVGKIVPIGAAAGIAAALGAPLVARFRRRQQ